MLTVSSKPSFSIALMAARRARAVPQLPLPMTATFSVLPVPSIGSNLARNGTMAGDEPRRGLGTRSEGLRAIPTGLPSASTPAAAADELADVCVSGFIVSLAIALRSGEGGRDEPGVDTGDTGLLPGSEASWNPSGEPGAVEGGESLIADVFAERASISAERFCWVDMAAEGRWACVSATGELGSRSRRGNRVGKIGGALVGGDPGAGLVAKSEGGRRWLGVCERKQRSETLRGDENQPPGRTPQPDDDDGRPGPPFPLRAPQVARQFKRQRIYAVQFALIRAVIRTKVVCVADTALSSRRRNEFSFRG